MSSLAKIIEHQYELLRTVREWEYDGRVIPPAGPIVPGWEKTSRRKRCLSPVPDYLVEIELVDSYQPEYSIDSVGEWPVSKKVAMGVNMDAEFRQLVRRRLLSEESGQDHFATWLLPDGRVVRVIQGADWHPSILHTDDKGTLDELRRDERRMHAEVMKHVESMRSQEYTCSVWVDDECVLAATLPHAKRGTHTHVMHPPFTTRFLSVTDSALELLDLTTPTDEEQDDLTGYASADTLSLDHGIQQSRLSEGKKNDRIKSKAAPTGLRTTDGKSVRVVYHIEDAKRYASPKRRRARTRGTPGL